MKTILYNPIFINPQAYYVFPQLYDIEKGDSFIEPAVYSGYLIIEDLISNTSSQVINTKEVDFTEFAGKRIRISQYTNLGAVVLGEWLLPEGEPSGPSFHQSLVDAWFMSGLSNADKPGSITGVMGNEMALKNFTYSLSSGFGKYEIDFNSWTKNVNAANFTNSDLVADSKFLQTSIDATISSYQVKVEGITDDIKLRYVSYAEDGTGTYTYLKNGINNLPISYKKYTGFAASVVGACNITITQLPSAYEGALIFDGVDDYGICTGLPILDDYTLICRRNILNELPGYIAYKAISDKGSFHFESRISSNNTIVTFSFGQQNRIKLEENEVSWMTRTSYNGIPINFGDASDTDQLHLCKFYNLHTSYPHFYIFRINFLPQLQNSPLGHPHLK